MEKNKDNEIYVEDYYPENEYAKSRLSLEEQAYLASKVSQYRDFYENNEYQNYDNIIDDIDHGRTIRGSRR